MNWYLAKLAFKITNNDDCIPQFEEQLRLIQAFHPQEALSKAELIGRNEEEEFVNQQQIKISWKFLGTTELIPLQSPKDGMEFYSLTPEAEDAFTYIDFIKRKHTNLQEAYSNIEQLL